MVETSQPVWEREDPSNPRARRGTLSLSAIGGRGVPYGAAT